MAKHSARFKWKAFGRSLRRYREEYGWSLRHVARVNKITHSTWCRAENGLPVTVPAFLYLCQWMNARPYDFAVRSAVGPLVPSKKKTVLMFPGDPELTLHDC